MDEKTLGTAQDHFQAWQHVAAKRGPDWAPKHRADLIKQYGPPVGRKITSFEYGQDLMARSDDPEIRANLGRMGITPLEAGSASPYTADDIMEEPGALAGCLGRIFNLFG